MRRALTLLRIAALLLAWPGVLLAAPEGEQVVFGGADFLRDGNTTIITTTTPDTIVQYSGFDIGVLETVRIDQPDAASRILNQVLSSDPTFIDGRLLSNGQVWVVNPVGVFFGDRAVVDVGGLVAAAGEVSHADFLDGVHHFANLSGPIEVSPGAVVRAADRVLLVGESVANYGHISAPGGMIALVAGGGARFAQVDGHVVVSADPVPAPDAERPGVVQAGTLDAGEGAVHLTAGDAYSLAMNHTGITRAREIYAEGGEGGLVRVAGTLDASDAAAGGRGGRIAVRGERVLLEGATLDASGDAGGGEILVGGDAHGGGPGRNAQRTYVSSDSVLVADAGREGDGGRIIVWADDATAFYGALSARGGSGGGDGGFAEISGARSLVSRGSVDLGADAGRAGTLLYDPARILIQGGVSDGSDSDDANPPEAFLRGETGTPGAIAADETGAEPFVIFESEIEGTDANIVLQASQSIETGGEFDGDDVALRSGRDLVLEVVDAGEPIGAGEIVGIDVARDGSGDVLTIVLSDGGTLRVTTESSEGRAADIAVGNVVTTGVREGSANSVALIATGAGSIAVESIDTSGAARVGEGEESVHGVTVRTIDGGNVSLLTQTGAISVGRIEARGGDASAAEPGDGGRGGDVLLSALEGPITVGSIDASGGDGVARWVDDGAGGLAPDGRGGDGGTISLVADLDPADPEAALPGGGDPRVITVDGSVALSEPDPDSGDPRFGLYARGGDGLGELPDAGGLQGADGGAGGQIFVSAGHVAEEGRVVLGSTLQPVRLDASGGDGTAAGGAAGAGGESAFTGAAIGAIRVEAHGDVDAGAALVATGGEAGFDAALGSQAGPGGAGGRGGDVSLASVTGDVTIFDTGAPAGVVLDGGDGRIDPAEVLDADGFASFAGAGGAAGRFTAEAAGEGASVALLAALSARGGAGSQGAGGAGGDVTLTALDGAATIFGADTRGGVGVGAVGTADGALEPEGVLGGDGGDITVTTQAGSGEGAVGGGDLLLGGALVSLGGAGEPDPEGDAGQDPNENHGRPGAVRLTSVVDVAAAPGGAPPRITSGEIEIRGRNVFSAPGPDLVLASSGDSAPASSVDRATVEAAGDARVLLEEDVADRFERLELIQTEASGDFDVLREDGATVVVRATGAGDVHTIQEITTGADDPHLTYRLADTVTNEAGDAELIDRTTLVVASGAVSLGAAGGKLANARADATRFEGERLTGRIQGEGAGPHVTTVGNLELFATNLGDETPLVVSGAGGASPSVEVSVSGDVDLDVEGSVAIVDLTQRRALGEVGIDLVNGGRVDIEGTVVDDGASRIEGSRITRLDTTGSDLSFFFHLADATASSDEPTLGEPVLTIANGAVTLGGADAGIATRGDLVLEGGPAPAIDAGGATVALVADSNFEGTGSLTGAGAGVDIANAGGLVALAGEGVGSADAPLRVTASGGELALAGSGGEGDFAVENVDPLSGALALRRIPLAVANEGESEAVSFRGVHAGGDVVLGNAGGAIELGEVQPDLDESVQQLLAAPAFGLSGADTEAGLRFGFGQLVVADDQVTPAVPATTTPHVTSGGDQRYAGNVLLANPRSFDTTSVDPDTGVETTETTMLHEVRLQADGDVLFEGDVDTRPDLIAAGEPGSLRVDAATTSFAGDVGSDVGGAPGVDALVTRDVLLTAGPHTFTVASADFHRVDGPGSLLLRGLGAESRAVFRGDVGVRESLAAFDADADLILFDVLVGEDGKELSSADRVVADSVSLNTATPTAAVPEAATIADTRGGLTVQSAGDVAVGASEKLSANGTLVILAGGTATLGDLAATAIRVDAERIVIQGRAPGSVALPGGGVVQDAGVDWVANDIVTNVVPEWDGVGARPLFVLGSGGLRVGGPPPFDVIRFSASLDEIGAGNLSDGERVLDLTGLGPRVVSDPSDDVPRRAPPVSAEMAARFSDTRPAADPPVTGEDVLATLRCRTEDGAPCLPEVAGDGLLASERIREIVERYHDLVRSPRGRQRLAAAFHAVDGVLAPDDDGSALYAALSSRRPLTPAREQVDALAVVLAQVSLLGLDPEGAARVRAAIARDFALATGQPGIDAEIVLGAAAASGVGTLP